MSKLMITLTAFSFCVMFSAHASETYPNGARAYSACHTLNNNYTNLITILKDQEGQLFLQNNYWETNHVTYTALGKDPLQQPVVIGSTTVTSLEGAGQFQVETDRVGSWICGVPGFPGNE